MPKCGINRQPRFLFHSMIIFLILLINQIQSPEQEIIIEDDGLLAEGNDETRETAGGEDCGRFAKFFFHAVHDAVEHGGVSVKETALHAVGGVGSDDLLRCIQADAT